MNVQHIVTIDELEKLIEKESPEDKIAARVAFRHHQVMASITDASRRWATRIGKVHLEEVLGQSIDL